MFKVLEKIILNIYLVKLSIKKKTKIKSQKYGFYVSVFRKLLRISTKMRAKSRNRKTGA